MVVPVSVVASPFFTGAVGTPSWYSCVQIKPSRLTFAERFVESALTTEEPTPCSPPETE